MDKLKQWLTKEAADKFVADWQQAAVKHFILGEHDMCPEGAECNISV